MSLEKEKEKNEILLYRPTEKLENYNIFKYQQEREKLKNKTERIKEIQEEINQDQEIIKKKIQTHVRQRIQQRKENQQR
jgi:hypothetical protein